MAQFFPENYSKEPDPNDPEYQVFEILHDLPDHYAIIYSKKLKGTEGAKEETEFDFLIFDGEKNLINLEVKGGAIEYNGATSRWYQNGKEIKPSPDRQASAATHALIKFLGNDVANINVNWALGFPNCVRPGSTAPIAEVPDDLIIDERDFGNVQKAIERICAYNSVHFGKSGVRRHFAGKILERLLRSVGFVTKIGVRLIQDQSQLVKATDQQLEILEDLELNEKTAVMGYAGTGKTIIATEFAKRMADSGKRVLLLFYNRMVANSVRYGLGRDSPIECTTFHSLARREIEARDPSWWKANAKKDDDDFWETDAPLKMLEVLELQAQAYDTIIVDEGQDFKTEWFEILEKLLVRNEGSRYVVFYDANQDIFGRWGNLPWEPNTYTRKRLRKNCRNTKAIVDYLNSIIPSEMVAFENSPTGQPVVIKDSSNLKEQAEIIKNDVASFLKEGVDPGNIVILVNEPLAESSVSSIQKIGRYPVEWMGRTYRADAKMIQVTNIQNFKGLEADIVFITGLPADSSFPNAEISYTQASRARLLLILATINHQPETNTKFPS